MQRSEIDIYVFEKRGKVRRSTHRSAAHSTASLCPIVQLPLSESPREPLQNSLSRHRGQLIGPPAASAGTSLEHPSKSVAGARYVDLRQSPRSSVIEDHREEEESFSIPANLRPRVSLLFAYTKRIFRGNEQLVETNKNQISHFPVEVHHWWQFRGHDPWRKP